MHPISAGRGTLGPYLAAWTVPAALLSALLALLGIVPWKVALWVALPLTLVHAFVCLGAYYLCRATPLHTTSLTRLSGSQLGAAMVSAAVLLAAARGWVAVLAHVGVVTDAAEVWPRLAPVIFVQSTLLYVLVAALYYLLAALEASRRAETEALRLELLSRDAELRALRTQIHPHFLFNSLNSINALIGADPPAARQTCLMLADLLRSNLTLGARERITLAEEMALVERLLAIEKVRFGSRLVEEIRVAADASTLTVPPLLLQPLVENAVKHGIAERVEGGTVRIEAHRQGDRLEVVIENPCDPLAAPRKGTEIGLANVQRRVSAAYGREGRVVVEAAPDRFRVRLSLPIVDQP